MKKIRRMELTAGAPVTQRPPQPNPTGLAAALADRPQHERTICAQAEIDYQRLVTDWQRTGTRTAITT